MKFTDINIGVLNYFSSFKIYEFRTDLQFSNIDGCHENLCDYFHKPLVSSICVLHQVFWNLLFHQLGPNSNNITSILKTFSLYFSNF